MLQTFNATGLSGLAVGGLFGGMLFFSFVMAPLIFRKLPLEAASRFVRQVFPIYYLAMGALAASGLVLVMFASEAIWSLDVILLAAILLGFAVSRQLLMPRINFYRDRELAGDTMAGRWFARLHASSVAINLLQLLASSIVLLRISSL